VIQSDITITLNFSRFIVQDLDSFFLFITCRKIDGKPKAIAMRLFVFPAKEIPDSLSGFIHIFFWGGGERHNQWLNEPITPFSVFPPFALFLAPQN
jgi:hypothetical protein